MSAFIRHPVLVMMLWFALPAGLTASQTADTAGVGPETYEYEILRKGTPVGTHQVQVQHHGDHTRVVCRSHIRIRFLGLTFYRFRYESEEEWDAEGLRRLLVRVNDDGERLEIDGHRRGDLFDWTINDTDSKSHGMPVYPTNHWNSAVLSQTRVLNTLTGVMNHVAIQPYQEQMPVFDRTMGEVRKYRYSGELRLETWYDVSGRWMGMRFAGRDGSTIEYRCRNCGDRQSL